MCFAHIHQMHDSPKLIHPFCVDKSVDLCDDHEVVLDCKRKAIWVKVLELLDKDVKA